MLDHRRLPNPGGVDWGGLEREFDAGLDAYMAEWERSLGSLDEATDHAEGESDPRAALAAKRKDIESRYGDEVARAVLKAAAAALDTQPE